MDWTRAEDSKLMSLINSGKSASQIAPVFGVTRNAVIARSNRVRGVVFQSDLDRRARERREAAQRMKLLDGRRKAGIEKLKHCLGSGVQRDRAIVLAIQAGAPMRRIGQILGITFQRVQQINARAG